MISCSACQQSTLKPFVELTGVPVHVGVLWRDPDQARAATRGDITLAACSACGWVYNVAFTPELVDYSQKYDNALHASPAFRAFEQELADHLAGRYGVAGGTIAEIGCGSGHFLGLLCGIGDAKGLGFDPSHDPDDVDPLARGRVRFVRGEFTEAADHVDLLVCRQTLEHIADPVAFLRTIQAALEPGTAVYFEVPNSTMAFADLSIWDLIYEHCSYFVEPSLRYLFEATGFEILDLRTVYEGQFLAIEARPTVVPTQLPPAPGPGGLGPLPAQLAAFGSHVRERLERWRVDLATYAARGTPVVLWGGGARAVSFFNLLEVGDQIRQVVDLNPNKAGTYLTGTAHLISGPEALVAIRPEVVIIVNELYRTEIGAALRDLGIDAELRTA